MFIRGVGAEGKVLSLVWQVADLGSSIDGVCARKRYECDSNGCVLGLGSKGEAIWVLGECKRDGVIGDHLPGEQ